MAGKRAVKIVAAVVRRCLSCHALTSAATFLEKTLGRLGCAGVLVLKLRKGIPSGLQLLAGLVHLIAGAFRSAQFFLSFAAGVLRLLQFFATLTQKGLGFSQTRDMLRGGGLRLVPAQGQ